MEPFRKDQNTTPPGLVPPPVTPYDKARERLPDGIDPSTGQPYKKSSTPWGLIVLVGAVLLVVYLYRTLY